MNPGWMHSSIPSRLDLDFCRLRLQLSHVPSIQSQMLRSMVLSSRTSSCRHLQQAGAFTSLQAAACPQLQSSRRSRSSRRMCAPTTAAAAAAQQTLTITAPDDWHLHVRDGDNMRSVVPHSAAHFQRAIIMPNLVPPVTTTQLAQEYKQRISAAIPTGSSFQPLMTLYLTDNTPPEEVYRAKQAGVVAFKLYPAGATTNSDSGVTDFKRCLPTLQAMADAGLLLLVHGEVTDSEVDMFDREAVFIEQKLKPLRDQVPALRVAMEHITTADAAAFVAAAPANVAASITPQHVTCCSTATRSLRSTTACRSSSVRSTARPWQQQPPAAAASSSWGQTAPRTPWQPRRRPAAAPASFRRRSPWLCMPRHSSRLAGARDKLEAFAAFNGPDFYGLPRNTGKLTLVKQDWQIPSSYGFGGSAVVPMWAGETLSWQVAAAQS